MQWLAAELHTVFEQEAGDLLTDAWGARDAYGAVANAQSVDTPAAIGLMAAWIRPDLELDAQARAIDLLEMERDALRLFTSCAWFFDDVARVEPRQVLTYAAHALQLAGPGAGHIESGFITRLADARANDPEDGTAADIFSSVMDEHSSTPQS